MILPTEIKIVPLDFDTTRNELIKFLKNQTEVKDYNYEGSAVSLLVDILSYDAYYHGWYTNFAVNESFLHTAQLRNSVVAAARMVGYTPRSTSASVAIVDVTVSNVVTSEASITIPKYSPFTATVSGQTYTFYTISDYSQYVNNANTVVFTGVELYEGIKLQQTFDIATVSNTGVSVTLLNQAVDTRTISVAVSPSNTSPLSYTYTRATNAVETTPTSNVYFLSETNEGAYQLQFGDNQIGRNLHVGQRVVVNYLYTNGTVADGASSFVYTGTALGLLSQTTNITVALNNSNIPSYGGQERESIEGIKKNAPKIYQIQGRIVTPSDARAVILSEVSGVGSATVWGGEDNDPPTYGKMFISLKPLNSLRYGSVQKEYIIKNVLRPKSMPTMGYELVDPDYVYIVIDTQVRYSPALTAASIEEIRQSVVESIMSYGTTNLGEFGSYFRYSQIVNVVDTADTSIQNNLTIVELEKRLDIVSTTGSYTVNFGNPIYYPGAGANVVSFTSSVGVQTFTHVDEIGLERRGCYVENNQDVLHVYGNGGSGEKIVVKSNVGSINFSTGVVTFTNFRPTGITTSLNNQLKLRAIPSNSDIVPNRNQIILIPRENIKVIVIDDLVNTNMTTFGRVTAGGRIGAGSYIR